MGISKHDCFRTVFFLAQSVGQLFFFFFGTLQNWNKLTNSKSLVDWLNEKCSKTLFFFSFLDIYFCPNFKSSNICWTNTSKNAILTILQRNAENCRFGLLSSLFLVRRGWAGRWKWRKWKNRKKSQAMQQDVLYKRYIMWRS